MKYIVKVYDTDYCLYEEPVDARSMSEAASIVQHRYGYVEGEVEYEVDYALDDEETAFAWVAESRKFDFGIDTLGDLTGDYSYLDE